MYLVTGGAGFIGSHVIDKLLARGDSVVCLDDFDNYYDVALKRRNVSRHVDKRAFTLIEGDIRDENLLFSLFGARRFRKIIHLAARVGVRASVTSPEIYDAVNVRGTLNLLEQARRHGIEQFIFASSSSIYGEASRIPFREEDLPGPSASPYAASKQSAEQLCRRFHEAYGIPISILRFFSVYGPRMRPDMAIHKFVTCIRQGRAVPMFGEGSLARDYTFIDDIVRGLIAALTKPLPFEVFNLGNESCVTLVQLISELERICGESIRIERLPLQPGDVGRTCADVSKARAMLGYNPTIDIRDGLEAFVHWFDEQTERVSNRESVRRGSGI